MTLLRIAFAAPALAAALLASAHGPGPETPFGRPVDPASAGREVRVAMADTMRFTPSEITVRPGEAVRFVVSNEGKVMHEMVLGTLEELRAHAEMMKKHPGMQHDEPNMVHLAPGKTGRIGWRFTRTGTFHYGCLVAGHFEAGMVGTIHVRER